MSDDTIYRQAAIDKVKKHYRAYDNDLLELITFELERLPSAQPERKRGKWIIDPLRSTTNDIYQVYRYLRCSECDHKEPWPWMTRRNFCPNCGADMR